jgi:hypothetical protein
VYSSTPAGRTAFRRWLESDADEDAGPTYELYSSHPLVKLLFTAHLDERTRYAKLASHAAGAAERLTALERLREIAPDEGADPLNTAWLDLEIASQRARISAIDRLLDLLDTTGAQPDPALPPNEVRGADRNAS